MALRLPALSPGFYEPPTLEQRPSAVSRLSLREKHLLSLCLGVLAAAAQGSMSFLDHLDELRKRLIVSCLALVVGFLIAFAFVSDVSGFIMRPLEALLLPGGQLIYTEPAEGFLFDLKAAALAGVFVAAPVVLWQIWLFIAPGLYVHEKKLAVPFVVFSTVCFLGGGLFSHYVAFPLVWSFFASFSTETVAFMPRIAPLFSLYTRMLLTLGVVFQIPTLAFFLARMGVITPRLLIRNTKYVVLATFVIAAVLTPPDPASQLLMVGPMLALYGLSILIAWLFGTRAND